MLPQTNMVGLEFLVMVCLCTTLTASPNLSNDENETSILRQQLKHLEETVSDLQKHMLAQEQKQAAVLSSVLSRLTETTEELEKLQQNYTELEFTSLRENYSSVGGAGKSFASKEVAFEANMAREEDNSKFIEYLANSVLLFPTAQYNKGGCWNSSNGVFTAPVNGTYMFWIDLTYYDASFFTVFLKRNDVDFGQAKERMYGRETAMISRISLTPLVKGDKVKFVADQNVKFWPLVSSCGGVLLF